MRIRTLWAVLAITGSLVAFSPRDSHAQALQAGVHGGYNLSVEEDPLFAGVQLRAGITNVPFTIAFNPSIETYFIEDLTSFQADANLLALIGRDYVQSFQPYAGAGLAVNYYNWSDLDSETRLGFNLLGGLTFMPGNALQPFVQARYTTADGVSDDYVSLSAGVLFSLGM